MDGGIGSNVLVLFSRFMMAFGRISSNETGQNSVLVSLAAIIPLGEISATFSEC